MPVPGRVSVRDRRLAEAGVLATVAMWSANFVIVKAAIGAIGPLTFTSARYVVAAATLLLLLRLRMGPIPRPGRPELTMVGLGMLGFGGYQLLWTLGLTRITAGDSALIIAVAPVLTALLAAAVGLDRLTPPKLVGALLAFAGVAVVIAAGHELSLGASLAGDLLTLGAAVVWAVYTVAATGMLRSTEPLVLTAWAVLGGALVLLPLGAWEVATSPPPEITPAVIAAVLYAGALAAGIANVFLFHAIRVVGPTRVGASQFLVPFGAVLLGAVLLDEPAGIGQLVGGVVIVLGVWLTRRLTDPAAVHGPSPGHRMTPDARAPLPDPPTSSPRAPLPVPPLAAGAPPIAILVDYDGTIAQTDVSDALMAEFVTDEWEAWVAEYDAGRVGSRRLMAWEVGLIDADPEALRAKAAAQPHDGVFVPFAERARGAGIPVEVVSDGFGFFIEPALASLGAAWIPVVTAATTFGPDGTRIDFPNGNAACFLCGTCKRDRVLAPPGGRAAGRVHRGRRVGPLCRGLRGRRVREALAGAAVPGLRLAVRALDDVRGDRPLAGRRARAVRRGPVVYPAPAPRPLFCGAEVWGPGRFDPPR